MYHEGNRQLQQRFGSTDLADRLLEVTHHTEFSDYDKNFIESSPFFFLATADAEGRPDCSFKGGQPGFVKVVGLQQLMFPDYDGNGMFKSMGNIQVNPAVGLLFITMGEKPQRIRVNGRAKSFERLTAAGRVRGCTTPHSGGCGAYLSELSALHSRSRQPNGFRVRACC